MSIIKKASPHSVSETMDKFEAIVSSKGFDVFARVDHQKNAQGADLEMAPAEVLIFGNPKGGTLLMNQNIAMSLDLPLRVAVYQQGDEVFISYHAPSVVADTHGIADHPVVEQLTGGLDNLTSAAIAV